MSCLKGRYDSAIQYPGSGNDAKGMMLSGRNTVDPVPNVGETIKTDAGPNLGLVQLGNNIVDFDRQTLRINDVEQNLRTKAIRVLELLVVEANRVVNRAEFIEKVWEFNEFTGERGVTDTIWELRQTLDQGKILLETIPKKGYRLTIEPIFLRQQLKTEITKPLEGTSYRKRAWLLLPAFLVIFVIAYFQSKDDQPAVAVVSKPNQTSFTNRPGVELMPNASPNGKLVCYIWLYKNESKIVVRSIDGSRDDQVVVSTPGNKASPVWSPDGDRLAYLEVQQRDIYLWIVNVVSGQSRKLTTSTIHEGSRLAWSRDGLIYTARVDASWALIALNLNTLMEKQLTWPESGQIDSKATISPEQSRIAFIRTNIEKRHRNLIILDNGEPAFFNEGEFNQVLDVIWLNNYQLLFNTNDQVIRRLDTETGDVQPLFESVDLDFNDFTVLTHGRLLAGRAVLRKHIEAQALDHLDQPPSVLIESLADDISPNYSILAEKLVFVSFRSGTPELWTSNYDGSNLSLLVHSNHLMWKPTWSPDAHEVAYIQAIDNRHDYQVVSFDLNSEIETQWTDDEYLYAGVPAWAPDGESIIVGRTSSHSDWSLVRVWRNHEIEDLEINSFYGQFSEGGSSIYSVPLDRPGLWRFGVTDGSRELLIDQPVRYTQWIRDDGQIFYMTDESDSNTLGVFNFDDRTTVPLKKIDSYLPVNETLAFDRARRRLIFSTVETLERDLVLLTYDQDQAP